MRSVPLTNGGHALVDDQDWERVSARRWCRLQRKDGYTVYARSTGSKDKVPMHRFILNAPIGVQVDHKNGDGLDNRRLNLRLATGTQNQANRRPNKETSSVYKGVFFDNRRNKWTAVLTVKGKQRYIGGFVQESDAAKAYDVVARTVFGEFARLNFPNCHDFDLSSFKRRQTSEHVGVGWSTRHNKWQARTMIAGRRVFLGAFDTEEEAAEVYATAKKQTTTR